MSVRTDIDDPFAPEADPYPPGTRIALREENAAAAHSCACGSAAPGPSLSRRHALLGMGALAALPVVASAEPFAVPCVQEKQKITPCRHRYCRHYGGHSDYHGR